MGCAGLKADKLMLSWQPAASNALGTFQQQEKPHALFVRLLCTTGHAARSHRDSRESMFYWCWRREHAGNKILNVMFSPSPRKICAGPADQQPSGTKRGVHQEPFSERLKWVFQLLRCSPLQAWQTGIFPIGLQTPHLQEPLLFVPPVCGEGHLLPLPCFLEIQCGDFWAYPSWRKVHERLNSPAWSHLRSSDMIPVWEQGNTLH